MREGVEEGVLLHERNAKVAEDARFQFLRIVLAATDKRGEIRPVQNEVDFRERQLAAAEGGRAEVLRGADFCLQVRRHADAGAVVEAPVLHKLARDLHRVPLDEVDARRVLVVHAREHLLEGVAELVEQRLDLAERQEAFALAVALGEVRANDRQGTLDENALLHAPVAKLVHPRAARFEAVADEGIEVEVRDGFPLLAHLEKADVLVPNGGLLRPHTFAHLDVEEDEGHLEKSLQDILQLEELFEILLAIGVFALAQPLGEIGDVPRHHVLAKGLILVDRLNGGRRVQLVDHLEDRLHRGRTLLRERERRVVGEAQERGHLPAQGQNLVDPRRVPRCAGDARAKEFLAHLAVGAMLHRLRVGRVVNRVGDTALLIRKRFRRVEDIVREVRREPREALRDLVEPRAFFPGQGDAGKRGGLNHLLQDAAARRRERRIGGKDALRDFVKAHGLPHAQGEGDDAGAKRLLGLAPRIRIHHAQHVANRAPEAEDGARRLVQDGDERLERRRVCALQRCDFCLRLLQMARQFPQSDLRRQRLPIWKVHVCSSTSAARRARASPTKSARIFSDISLRRAGRSCLSKR